MKFTRLRTILREYPNSFWVLTLSTFIDQIGTFMMFPFFGYYILDRFNVSYTGIGLIFTMFSVGGIIGGILGGALADKYGRKFILLFGLICSGLSSILMIFIGSIEIMYVFSFITGLLGSTGGPAHQAIVADLLPPKKQSEAFAILRVAFNVSAVIGPIAGGFLSTRPILFENPYFILFIADAFFSIITAIIVIVKIPETRPKIDELEKNAKEGLGKKEKSFMMTLRGYFEVIKDGIFILFVVVSSMMALVYMQMNSTLSVYLKDIHSFPQNWFGALLSTNALMVVILQFPISRWISKFPPMRMMAIGTLLYAIGFSMYGFVSSFLFFFVAMIIITVGEMIVAPFEQSIVALFAPIDKRGRYMAIAGMGWMIPSLFGIVLAGFVMDTISPSALWFFAGILALVAVLAFLGLHRITKNRFNQIKEQEEKEKAEKEIEEDKVST